MHDTTEPLRTLGPLSTSSFERLHAVTQMVGHELVVVANREPYVHERAHDGRIVAHRPPGGLVTAIEPVLRRCGGTWIAAATGSADRDTCDAGGRLIVPSGTRVPETLFAAPPTQAGTDYVLQRLWFDSDVYEHYYSGFSNEALWPLCHTAFTRPSFRPRDWSAYAAVNETFARAALNEIRRNSFVLVQDYHFALVPRLIREGASQAVTNLFWHIPWPNAEIFGICPWKEAILGGMLGADVIGFHTRQYCLNFLESTQRYLECRVDRDQMSVSFAGHRTLVRPYPISVEWPYPSASREEGAALREALGIAADCHVSLGVDRADYTKGLVEKIEAIEMLLDRNPLLAGRYVHVQLASPTRTHIPNYRQLASDLEEAAARVNSRFATPGWTPIILQMRPFSPAEVRRYYAMADSAIVTPLHDGMNLVAKEYVASRNDADGVLVLSIFAGAANELGGALLVNPYDSEQMAEAILRAIRMQTPERRARMQSMREQVAANSIEHWSARILDDLRGVRKQSKEFRQARPCARFAPTFGLSDGTAPTLVTKEAASQ